MTEEGKTTIAVSKELCVELKDLGTKGESYEDIIKRTIQFTKIFRNEYEFHSWFSENIHLFGFDTVKENNRRGYPDFVLMKSGAEVRVELETLSSNFILHKHDPTKVDLVICLKKDRELQVETLEISPFQFDGDWIDENKDFSGACRVIKVGNSIGVTLPKHRFRIGEEIQVQRKSEWEQSNDIIKHIKALPDANEIRTIVRDELRKVTGQ